MAPRMPIRPLLVKNFSWASIFEIQQCQKQSSPASLEMTISDGVLMFMDKMWVPDANNLRFRICIMGHCGIAGHLSFEGTKRRISQYFLWESFEEKIKSFCGSCLHCRVNNKPLIPRPLGEAVHETAPNQVLHNDCLYTQKRLKYSNQPFELFCS